MKKRRWAILRTDSPSPLLAAHGPVSPRPAPLSPSVAEAGKIPKPWTEAAPLICNGDALLFHRCKSWTSWWIGINSRSDISHIAMAVRLRGVLCAVEMVGQDGGRAIALEKYLRWGRRVDVYRIKATSRQRSMAADAMCSLMAQDYREESIWRQALITLPGLRLWTHWRHPELIEAATDDRGNGDLGPKVCSEGVLWSWRQAGLDLLPNLADWAAPPSQVVQTSACRYLFSPVLALPQGAGVEP